MADQSFPQIPSTVWWGVRGILQKTPSAKLDEGMLAAKLGVQAVASRQYLAELKRAGILDEEGRPTELAGKWRLDESYGEAVKELASSVYPESLVTIAPPGEAERPTVSHWFMSQGLGEGSARNKAATYLLLTSPEPSSGSASSIGKPSQRRSESKRRRISTRNTDIGEQDGGSAPPPDRGEKRIGPDMMPLNLNVQIHISADATTEQIDTIFESMRKHLYVEGNA